MQIVSFEQFEKQRDFFIGEALQNKIFVYPTDTLYGIGGVFNHQNIEKINLIKWHNTSKKLTIIAPSFEWIIENFYVRDVDYMMKAFEKYHGVTYILEPRNPQGEFSLYETAYDNNTIGVRIIKHPFQEFVAALNKPFIATSANFTNSPPIHTIYHLDEWIKNSVNYVIDGNSVYWVPSVLVYTDEQKAIHRQ